MTKKQQIVEYLLNEYIQPNKIGEIIETEMELVDRFKVSRQTIRSAMEILVSKGYIKRVKGHGSIVVSVNSIDEKKSIQKLSSYSEDVKARNVDASTKLRLYEIIPDAPAIVVDKLESEDTPLYHIIRTRYVDGKAISFDETYISTEIVSDMDIKILEGSLYNHIENTLGIVIDGAHQNVSAISADENVAKYLEVEIGSPVLKITSLVYTGSGEKMEYTTVYYRSDSYNLEFEAKR